MRQQKQPPKPSFLDAATHDGMIRTGMKKLDDEDPLQLILLSINRVCTA